MYQNIPQAHNWPHVRRYRCGGSGPNRAGREVRAGNLEVVIVKADEIRKQWNESMLEHQQADNLPYVVADVLVEIAAQLAELNETIKSERVHFNVSTRTEVQP